MISSSRPWRIPLVVVTLLLAAPLSACLYAQIPVTAPTSGTGPTAAPTSAPTTGQADIPTPTGNTPDWAALPGCPELTDMQPWVLVDDFPTAAVDAVGMVPACGDIWTRPNGDQFAGITVDQVTTAQIDALGEELRAARYVLVFDDFDPEVSSDAGYYGARDFYLDADTSGNGSKVALEIYPAYASETTWIVFIDFDSPSTRALGG